MKRKLRVLFVYPVDGCTIEEAEAKRNAMIPAFEKKYGDYEIEPVDVVTLIKRNEPLYEAIYSEEDKRFDICDVDVMMLLIGVMMCALPSCNFVLLCKDWPLDQECNVMLTMCKEFDIGCAGIISDGTMVFLN